MEVALSSNPYIKKWYEDLSPKPLQKTATKIFGEIEKASIDDDDKQNLYINGILSFEALKMQHALDVLDNDRCIQHVTPIHLGTWVTIDNIEAAHYHEIARGRLKVIRKFQDQVKENAKERVLQEYIFEHLWLLDPAWERATGQATMEESLDKVVAGIEHKSEKVRLDIRYVHYRKITAAHVIIELKRGNRALNKTEIESQLNKYINALQKELNKRPKEKIYPIEAICIVGKLPQGWDDLRIRGTRRRNP